MPLKLSTIRSEYPGFESISDDQLISIYRKHKYPDVPMSDFAKVLDYDTQREKLQHETLDDTNTFTAGMGRPVQQLINTSKRLTGNMSQEEAADEAQVTEPLMHTKGGFAGNLAGEAALTYLGARGLGAAANVAGKALPQTAAALARAKAMAQGGANTVQEVARAVPVAGRVLSPAVAVARTVTPAAAAGAVQGAAFSPEDFEHGAKWGGGGGAAGAGLAAGAGRVVGGALAPNVSQDARALMDQGVQVPLWKATENPQVRNAAERLRRFPVVGPVMKRQEAGAFEGYTQALQKQATPPRMPIVDEAGNIIHWAPSAPLRSGSAQDALAEIGDRFSTGYDALYRNRTFPVDEQFTSALEDLSHATRMHNSASSQGVDEGLARVQQLLMQGKEGEAGARSVILDMHGNPIQHPDIAGHAGVENTNIQQAIAELDQRITDNFKPGGNAVTARVLAEARDELQALRQRGLPPEVQGELGDMNAAYANYKLLQQAAKSGGAVRREGVVTPLQMTNAAIAKDRSVGKKATTEGTARGLRDAQRAQRVLGSELPEVGPGTADAGLLGLMLAGGWAAPTTTAVATGLMSPTGQRLLQGGYPWQTATREGTNTLARLLREGGRAGTVLGEAQAANPDNP